MKGNFYDAMLSMHIIGLFILIMSIPYFIINAIFNSEDDEQKSQTIGATVVAVYIVIFMVMFYGGK